jgi:hypothetical protein
MLEPRRLAAVTIPDFDVQVVARAATVLIKPGSGRVAGKITNPEAPGALVATRDSGPPR